MATRIIDRGDLNIGVELTIDEPNRIIELHEAGNLNAKEGVTLQALYSKISDLWTTEEYQDSPFPMNALDALSGQYLVGVDAGGNFNGWTFANDATRNMLRDGGWEEYDVNGNLLRVYAGFIGLGSINEGAQPYFHLDPSDAPTAFPFDDQFNVGVQVYGNADNGNFDKRTFAKTFVREQGRTYSESVLADTGALGTGAFKVNFLISNEDDPKVIADDSEMSTAPYDGITVSYYNSPQMRDVGGTDYPFDIVIDGNGATLEEIYTKVQYLLRQEADINESGDAGTVLGRTATELLNFLGDTLGTSSGVYVDNIQAADTNRIEFTDNNGTTRLNPFVAAGQMNFNAALVGAGSSYRMFFADNYGTAAAVTVRDANGDEIAGEITNGVIEFEFDYDGDTLGGPAGTDKPVVLMGIRPGHGKFAVTTGTLTRTKSLSLSLVAEADRAYN